MSANPSKSSPEFTTPATINSNPTLETRAHQFAPEHSPIVIEAGTAGLGLNLGELWRYRELLYFLTWRDIKVKYKQTLLGVAWAILQPLFAMLLFTLIFGRLAQMPSDGIPYALFAYAGLVPWTFFSNAVTNSGNSLVGSSNLITKIYFPRVVIPAAAVAAGLIDLAIAFLLLVPMLLYYGFAFDWSLLLLPLFVLLTTLLAVSVGMITSALNVKYRDVRYALPFLIQLWLFASPVIYPASLVPERWQWLLALNPMSGIIEGFRASLFGRDFDWLLISIAAGLTVVLLVASALIFSRVENSFADII